MAKSLSSRMQQGVCRERAGSSAMAKKLHRYQANGRRRSLRDISQELAAAGHLSQATTRYGAAAVARMIKA
jgi:hypothetical protein